MAFGNTSYDQILSSTLANHQKKLVDNIFKKRVLTWYLTQKNKIEREPGGAVIVKPLLGAEGSAGSYGENDAVTVSQQGGLTAGKFDWKLLQANIIITGLQELKNSGPQQMYDLLEAKVMQAEKTLRHKLNIMLFGDGTGNSNKDFSGLRAAIRAGEAGDTTYAGIDATDAANNSWWRSYAPTTLTGVAQDLRKIITTGINTASDGDDMTDGVFTTQTILEALESQLVPSARYVDKTSVDAGFQNILVHGVPVYWDRDAPAGFIFGLNSDYVKLIGHKDRWFTQTPFTQATSGSGGPAAGTWVDARMALILAAGEFVVTNRGAQFKFTGVDTFA